MIFFRYTDEPVWTVLPQENPAGEATIIAKMGMIAGPLRREVMPGEALPMLGQLRGRKHVGNSPSVRRESQTHKQAAVPGGRKGSGNQGLPIGKSVRSARGTCVLLEAPGKGQEEAGGREASPRGLGPSWKDGGAGRVLRGDVT